MFFNPGQDTRWDKEEWTLQNVILQETSIFLDSKSISRVLVLFAWKAIFSYRSKIKRIISYKLIDIQKISYFRGEGQWASKGDKLFHFFIIRNGTFIHKFQFCYHYKIKMKYILNIHRDREHLELVKLF